VLEDIVLKSGEKRQIEATVVCDGKRHGEEVRAAPFFVSPKSGTTKICNPNTLSYKSEASGQARDNEATFSADGKKLTYRRQRADADGKQTKETVVFAKQ
jgi:hypothetical protein